MAKSGKTFSESWHRVAELRLSLRPSVQVRRQWFRGERWYVLHDPFNNAFFRLRPEAHQFVIRLRPDRTVAEVWEDALIRDADNAPGQEDVIQLLGQLYQANLLVCDLPADSVQLFERYRDRRQREVRSTVLNLMFFRVPLFDPEKLLRRLSPLIRWVTGPTAVVLWLALALVAGITVIEEAETLAVETRNLLAFDNLVLLYGGMILVKFWHECGHAMVCHRFGGEVHTLGIMLMVFTPLPYMDATSSWSFRKRRERILVGAAGMLFELFAASCAALLWANTGPGILHSLAFNMMFVASVSTLAFNANPLLRYDGYYILTDLIGIPNLQSRSLAQLKYLGERYLFDCRDALNPAQSPSETFWLSGYGLLSGIYRLLVYGSIILFVADRFLLAGLLMAAICIFSWVMRPLGNFFGYIVSNPKLEKTRTRALAVTAAGLSLGLLLLAVVPVPAGFRAPGILESKTYVQITNESSGRLTKILIPSGTRVAAGTPLLQMENPELGLELATVSAQLDELLALRKQSLASAGDAESALVLKRMEALEQRLKRLEQQQQSLVVRSREAGTWVAADVEERLDSWLPRGMTLGVIFDASAFRFSAVVSQEEAANLFADRIQGEAEIRLLGQEASPLKVERYRFIPFQHETLPSAALGWLAGGEIPVSGKDASGLQTIEPFFQIYADLSSVKKTALYHGQSGQIRFDLPGEPILARWFRSLRQLLQRRYQT